MTDLSSLFTTLPPRTFTGINSFNPTQSILTSSPIKEKIETWRLSDLQSSLKKSIKTKLSASELTQEMHDFDKIQKEEFLNKLLSCIGLTLILSIFLEMQAKISFHFFILLLAQLILRTPFRIMQEPIISKSIQTVKPILYAALAYYLLKWSTGVPIDKINYPLTFASMLMGTIYGVLEYLDPVFSVQTKQIMLKAATSSKISKKVAGFPLLLLSRVSFIKKMHVSIATVFFLMAAFLLLFFKLCLSLPLNPCFQPFNMVFSLAIFVFLELLLMTARFIICGWMGRMELIRDKMPIYLTLLRLPSSSLNSQIQQKCLLSLYSKMLKIPCFLSTQTCKSLLFPTYMNLFNLYASSELQQLHVYVTKQLSKIEQFQKVIDSKKTLLDDIFIWFKKITAFLQQIHRTRDLFREILKKETLMRVIILSDQQAAKEKDNIRVTPRTPELMEMINEKIKKIKTKAVGGLKQELQGFENRLTGWLASMRGGWI